MADKGGGLLIGTVLENLGFRPNEIKTYLAALDSGETTISELACRVKLPRSSTQEAVNNLRKKSLMQCYLKRHRKIWVAEDPGILISIIREYEAEVRKVLPALALGRRPAAPKPSIRLFTGTEELKSISKDILNTRQHIYGIIAWDSLVQIFGLRALDDIRQKYHNHYLKLYLFASPSAQAREMKNLVSGDFLKVKFLPANLQFRNAYFAYGDKVVINLLTAGVPYGVVIEDRDLAVFARSLFCMFWEKTA